MNPVSVVIPAYRAAPSLDSALASIAGQTAPPAEVVVVDDASSDATADIASSWSTRLPLTVIELTENGGPARARHIGIAQATQPLIALLDADDVWLPNHLATLHTLHTTAGGIVTADAYRWVPGHRLPTRTYRDTLPVPTTDQLRELLRTNYVFVGSLFTRYDYEEAGGFRTGVEGAEDWDLWIRMVRAGVRVTGAPQPTVLYRLSPTGLTSSPDILRTYRRVLEWAERESVTEQERRWAAVAVSRERSLEALSLTRRAARRGDCAEARAAARHALVGPLSVKLEAVALTLAPGVAVGLGERLRHRRWMGAPRASDTNISW